MKSFVLLLLLGLSLVIVVQSKTYPSRYLEDEDDEDDTVMIKKSKYKSSSDKKYPPVSDY